MFGLNNAAKISIFFKYCTQKSKKFKKNIDFADFSHYFCLNLQKSIHF